MHRSQPTRRAVTFAVAALVAVAGACSDAGAPKRARSAAAPGAVAHNEATTTAGRGVKLCKESGPAGAYTFNIEVTGGVPNVDWTLPNGTQVVLRFDGVYPVCTEEAKPVWQALNPDVSSWVTITEVVPTGVYVQKIDLVTVDALVDTKTGTNTISFPVNYSSSLAAKYYNQTLSALGDFVWEDLDADGIQQAGEAGIPGVTLRLSQGGTTLATATTDANGGYLFPNLAPGCYDVSAVAPAGYVPTVPNVGDPDKDSNVNPALNICLGPGESNLTIDFGFRKSAAIGDFVWEDSNRNGIQEVGEPGIPGVTVKLLDCSNNVLATTTTTASGLYAFTSLAPGGYKVQVVAPSGFSFTLADQGPDNARDSDVSATTGVTGCYTLTGGQVYNDADAGLYRPAAIGDFVWNDANKNGVQELGELGFSGFTVNLLDCSGTLQATTTTDGNGAYAFTGLVPGSYKVEFDAPVGYVFSARDQGSDDAKDSDADPSSGITSCYTLVSGQVNNTVDAGLVLPVCTDPNALNYGQSGECEYPPETSPCPGGTFMYNYLTQSGDLYIKYDQFPAPNDNSYGINAVGWPNGHKFGDLTGSDHAGFELVDAGGTVRLSFNVDYLSASSTAPSGYASLGVTGGDGKMIVGTASGITATTSLARNLNNINIPGLFSSTHVQQFGSVNVLVNSPPTDPLHQTYNISDPTLAAWDFHDTYYVTISAAKLASIGFNPDTWKVQPNPDQLHNSPAKACPTTGATVSVTKYEVKDRQVKVTILNSGTTAVYVEALTQTWPAMNGKLMQVKLDGDVVYGTATSGGSVSLTTAQLNPDPNKRKIDKGTSDVYTLVFEKNADPDLSHYTGTVTISGVTLAILPK